MSKFLYNKIIMSFITVKNIKYDCKLKINPFSNYYSEQEMLFIPQYHV